MPTVYEWEQDYDHYQYFVLNDDSPTDIVFLNGSPALATWRPPFVTIERATLKLRKGDLWNFGGGAPILSERAVDVLRERLEPVGELLPMSYQGVQYWVLNVTSVVDCLDHDETIVLYSRKTSSISDAYKQGRKGSLILQKQVFDARKLGTAIFRVPQNPAYLFVLDEFVDAVKAAGLLGFRFVEKWRS